MDKFKAWLKAEGRGVQVAVFIFAVSAVYWTARYLGWIG